VAIRITCISKEAGRHEDPHVAISFLGWVNPENGERGKSTRIDVHTWVSQGGKAFVQDSRGDRAYLVARTSAHGNPYVQSIADGILTDNLLRLPECTS
jgi:hypothetical protein